MLFRSGADATLRSRAIDIVYMELIVAPTYVGQRKLHEYLALLDSHGYVLFDFYNRARRNGRLIQADALFVSAPFLDAFGTSTARPRAPRV